MIREADLIELGFKVHTVEYDDEQYYYYSMEWEPIEPPNHPLLASVYETLISNASDAIDGDRWEVELLNSNSSEIFRNREELELKIKELDSTMSRIV
jgi:hypothetical protein